MVGKLARIFGITGGALTLLPCLVYIVQCAYTLSLPDTTPLSWETKGYTFGFMTISFVPAFLAAVGFIGSFFVHKKHILAGVMMVASGALILVISPFTSVMIFDSPVLRWLYTIFSLLLIAAGILALIPRPVIAPPKHQEISPSPNAQ